MILRLASHGRWQARSSRRYSSPSPISSHTLPSGSRLIFPQIVLYGFDPMISRRNLLMTTASATAALMCGAASAARPGLTVGAVQFGTLHWLLDVIKERKLDAEEGFELSTRMVATPGAANIALLGHEADVVVTDWFWVMRQRSLGGDYLFMPYTAALGGVIVPGDSPIKSVSDLKGKKIGVAGGPIDKSWLLLRAYGIKSGAGDLAAEATPVFAAPPLLNEQAAAGRIDALLNFWPFAVKLSPPAIAK